jgi:hypothetical protein
MAVNTPNLGVRLTQREVGFVVVVNNLPSANIVARITAVRLYGFTVRVLVTMAV